MALSDLYNSAKKKLSDFASGANNVVQRTAGTIGGRLGGNAIANFGNQVRQGTNVPVNAIRGIPKAFNTYTEDLVNDRRTILPYLNTSKDTNLAQTGLKKLANFGSGTINRVATEGVLKPTYDIGSGIATLNAGQPVNRSTFKSGAVRTGANLAGGGTNLQTTLGDIGQMAAPILESYGAGKVFGLGKQSVNATARTFPQIARQSSKVAGNVSGLFGLAEGAQQNRDKSLGESLFNTAKSGAGAYLGGRAVGLAIPYAGRGAGRIASDVKQAVKPTTIHNPAQKYINTGSLISSDGNYPKMVDPNYFKPKSLLFKGAQKIEEAGVRPGMSIKDVGKKPLKVETPIQIPKESGKYKTVRKGGVTEIVDGKPVKLADGIDTFTHKDVNGNWVVSETKTGKSLNENGGFPTEKHAIEDAKASLDYYGVDKVKKELDKVNTNINEIQSPSPIQTPNAPQSPLSPVIGGKPPVVPIDIRVKGGAGRESKIPIINERSGLPVDKTKTLRILGGADRDKNITIDSFEGGELTDISPTSKGFKDIYRNFETFFGNKSEQVKKSILDPFDAGKKQMFSNMEAKASELQTKIADNMGFKKGGEKSADLQRFGEGSLTKQQIVEKYGKDELGNFIHADNWFRKQYDTMLGEVNAVRAKIYPNNPEKQIPKRNDYYRHFKEMQEGFSGLANIFDTPAGVSSNLAGISQFAKPKSKWLSFAQKRLGGETTEDAVGGFIDYIKASEYAKNIDPHIENFRDLTQKIIEKGTKEQNGTGYNNMIEFLQDFTDDLSGKTNPLDRGIQKYIPGGRKTFAAINWLNSRVKANTILGNASSALAQIFNVPQGIASAGEKNFAKGIVRLGRSIGQDDAVMRQSGFLKERYFDGFDKFDTGVFNNTKKTAAWMITVFDELGTKAIWNAHYEKALADGITNPVLYADDMARKLVAGRGIGEVPLVQKSKMFQLAAPFQLEVTNVWHVLGDFKKKGDYGKIMKMLAYTYLFNRVVEKVRGSDVAFDPIQSLIEGTQAFNEEDDKKIGAMKFIGRQAGEVLSNVPLGQTVAGAYPEYGFSVGETKFPVRKDLFGEGDPTRFGSGLLAMKGLQDPLVKVLPPFGGVQVKRTYDAIKSQLNGSVETPTGKTMFPITETSPIRTAQRAIFGKYSTPEATQYFDEKRTPLGDVQTEKFKIAGKNYYDKVMNDRVSEKEKTDLKAGSEKTSAQELGAGMKQLSNGEIYIPDMDKTFKTKEQAEKAVKLRDFLESDNNSITIGEKYYYKDDSAESGYRSKSVDSNISSISNLKMDKYKREKDIKSWMSEAENLYKNYEKQLEDPNLDEGEKLAIQDDMDILSTQFAKYKGYGAFTKGASGSAKADAKKAAQYESVSNSPSALLSAIRAKYGNSKAKVSFSMPTSRQTRMTKVSRRAPKQIKI